MTPMRKTTEPALNYNTGAVRAILFDKDGTLFDFRGTWLPVFQEAAMLTADGDATLAERLLHAAGYDAQSDTFVPDGPIAAGSAEDVIRTWEPLLPGRDKAFLLGELDRYSAEIAPLRAQPVCDLSELMKTLCTGGYVLGLATSDSLRGARESLDRFGLEPYFRWVSGDDSGHGHKPDPRVVEGFARAVGVLPAQVAMVGDTFHDMRMGREAGVALLVGVLTGAVSRELLAPEADVVLESIAGLPELLNIRVPRRKL
jgi:phosphoglycolate phosphatase